MTRFASTILAILLIAAVSTPRVLALPRENVEPLVDSPMNVDPNIRPLEPERVFADGLAEIWKWALEEPDADTRRRTADSIASAHASGMPGLDAFVPKLIELLNAPQQHRLVKLAMVKALIALDARDAAVGAFFQHNRQDGVDMVLATDAALARWKHEPAKDVWLKRMADSKELLAVRISALESAAAANAPAAERARTIVLDRGADETLRLAAADTLAVLSPSGLETTSQQLQANNAAALERLLAAKLLTRHTGSPAEAMLLTLARDEEPAVARAALARLVQVQPLAVKPVAAKLFASPDAEIRRLAAEAVVTQRSPETITTLFAQLDDADYRLRRRVRDLLLSLDKESSLKAPLREAAMAGLLAKSWRVQEQAVLMVGKLDHKPAAPTLLTLIDVQRPEVRLAAVASLRWLAVPETLPPLLAHAQSIVDRSKQLAEAASAALKQANDLLLSVREKHDPRSHVNHPPPLQPRLMARGLVDTDRELSQIFQMMGTMRYAPAEPLLRAHVPKHSFPWTTARGAAIWTLGYLHEGKPDDALAAQFAARAGDNNPLDPEAMNVREMSAKSIGRMKATSALGSMQALYKALDAESVILSARWAVVQITGQEVPLPKPQPAMQGGWFLEPVR